MLLDSCNVCNIKMWLHQHISSFSHTRKITERYIFKKDVFKKDDRTICDNYRRIALLSNISKIIEKLIHTRFTMFLNKNNVLYERQFGFRPNGFTTHTLLEITEKIKQACNSGKYTCEVFLNLQKAFNTVNRYILLKKLNHYGIRGIANNCVVYF